MSASNNNTTYKIYGDQSIHKFKLEAHVEGNGSTNTNSNGFFTYAKWVFLSYFNNLLISHLNITDPAKSLRRYLIFCSLLC